MTLAFEGAYSKLVEAVTISHVDDEIRDDNSFGADLEGEVWSKKLSFYSDFEHKVSRFV